MGKQTLDKNFNPFYDSEFKVVLRGEDPPRYLVELCRDELELLQLHIDSVLIRMA